MKIIKGFPPNIDEIKTIFNLEGHNPIFTYYPNIYYPNGESLPDHLEAHEGEHLLQQEDFGGAEKWWKTYLSDQGFRLNQELQAYRAQYKVILENYARPMRRQMLDKIARDLSGSMYGNIISFARAKELISWHMN